MPVKVINIREALVRSKKYNKKAFRDISKAVRASNGQIALVMHPYFFTTCISEYGFSPFESSKLKTSDDISIKRYGEYLGRIKRFVSETRMPVFIFTHSDRPFHSVELPKKMSWFAPKTLGVLVPTSPFSNPDPQMKRTEDSERQWQEFRSFLKKAGVKDVSLGGELSFKVVGGSTPVEKGCYDVAFGHLRGSFVLTVDQGLAFPNAIFTPSA